MSRRRNRMISSPHLSQVGSKDRVVSILGDVAGLSIPELIKET